jgi:hypothetical protein
LDSRNIIYLVSLIVLMGALTIFVLHKKRR